MRHLLASCALVALLAPLAASAQSAPAPAPAEASASAADPFAWLEDVDGARSLEWVHKQNVRTAARLEGDPRYEVFRKDALAIFTAQDRIPMPARFRAGGVDNFWQDDAHPKGLWRHASLDSYRSSSPQWETVIDFDALSKAEGKNWIFKGVTCLKPAETVCLVRMSDGGGDSVELREFDTAAKGFVEGGLRFSNQKQYAEWLDHDTLLMGRDWKEGADGGELTDSGYPYVLKIVKRGQPADQAHEVFRGQKSDVWAQPRVLRGDGGKVDAVIVNKGLSFYDTEYYLLGDGQPVRLPLPLKSSIQAYVKGQLVFTLQQDWNGFKQGDLLSYDLASLKADPAAAKPVLITRPGPTQSIDNVDSTHGRVVVQLLDNVKSAVDLYDYAGGGRWTHARMAGLPADAHLPVVATSDDDDRMFVSAESFLEPTSLWLADAASGQVVKVKAMPARFDGSRDEVSQYFATSTDGTKIPYFLVTPKGMKLDGSTPTLMFGYGGFQISETPSYRPELGKLWLERGGAYVLANIRGGGEFGPAWHESALREHRQRAFDDFASIARDVFARKISSPRHFGIYGRSNGGVLTTVSMTQHPELWNAVVIESPLVDMLRYNHLSAGASWVGEYGDPDKPEDRAFIAKYSGYQALKAGQKYPEPYITTNTKDDRVHPSHARKFAAKLEALGYPYLYYENTFGGHANDADPELNARRWARHYVYLSQKLMDGDAPAH
jgi:prolyl oligopeptidase